MGTLNWQGTYKEIFRNAQQTFGQQIGQNEGSTLELFFEVFRFFSEQWFQENFW